MHFLFLFIGCKPTTWLANNCLPKMVCSCIILSKCVLLQMIFCLCVIIPTRLSENGRSLPWADTKDINTKPNLIEASYHTILWFVSVRSVICLTLQLWQISVDHWQIPKFGSTLCLLLTAKAIQWYQQLEINKSLKPVLHCPWRREDLH